ncbi:MAG: LCP family protein [Lachnospiraceae bacterium]|jgi:LCP family protein required for cell wall assembly
MRQETYHTSKRTPTGLEYARKRQVQIHREGGYDSRENRRRKRPKGRKNQKAAYLFLVILAIAAAFSVGSFIKAYGTLIKGNHSRELPGKELENPLTAGQDSRRENWTIAVFGVDSADGSLGKGANADTILLCSLNQKTGAIRMASVYRDTCMKVGENGPYRKINEAYARGGAGQAVQALNENLDLEIDDYVAVNWKAAADAINLLGGIEVDVSQAEFEYINSYITSTVEGTGVGSHQLKAAGPNHLDGIQAVAYARLRKMDTDFQRTKRQRNVLQKVLEKGKTADLATLTNLAKGVLPQLSTSLELGDLIPIAVNLKNYHFEAAEGFPFNLETRRLKEKGVSIDYVFPMDLESNVVELHRFLYGNTQYQVSGQVKEISRNIENKRKTP